MPLKDTHGWERAPRNWRIERRGYQDDAARAQSEETLFTLANGAIGVRGACDLASPHAHPATYMAGLFDKPDRDRDQGKYGLSLMNKALTPALAVLPDFFEVEILADNETIDHLNAETVRFQRVLDLRRGLLFCDMVLENPCGRRTAVRTERLISAADPRLAASWLEFEPLNYEADITVRFLTKLRTGPQTLDRLRDYVSPSERLALDVLDDIAVLHGKVRETGEQFSCAARTTGPGPASIERTVDGFREVFVFRARPGQCQGFARGVCLERRTATTADAIDAAETLYQTFARPVADWREDHVSTWRQRWETADIVIDGDDEIQQAVRWSLFQLLQLGVDNGGLTSIAATGLHGQGYFGHVFWDTEIWMLPFYAATNPPVARSLLQYRHRRLAAARVNASQAGCAGAKFPWTSADTGLDVTPPDWAAISQREIHINAAVAYAFWLYRQWTRDDDFYYGYGLEVMVETARFWQSRLKLDTDGRYHLYDIVGPDEYNVHADDNFYTLYLARWNMLQAVTDLRELKARDRERFERLSRRVGWTDACEIDLLGAAGNLAFPRLRDGVREQHRGFFELPDVPPVTYDRYGRPVSEVAYTYDGSCQLSKQADTVMISLLLPHTSDPDIDRATYDYYLPRCNQGSSLSPSCYGIVGLRLGRAAHAYRHLRLAALMDLQNLHLDQTLADGIHAGCCGGVWQTVVLGYGGINVCHGYLQVQPQLPPAWRRLCFRLRFQGRRLDFQITPGCLRVALQGDPLEIVLGDRRCLLTSGEPVVQPLDISETRASGVPAAVQQTSIPGNASRMKG